MKILAEITPSAQGPEMMVAALAIVGLLGIAVWRFVLWLIRAKPTPDPWDETIAAEIEKDDATPLCHHCLCPHSEATDFCAECGTPVGQYTNWLPFPQLFSIGHMLRAGTSGDFKRTPFTILGFLLFSLAEYMLFVPIYWIVFLRKVFQHPSVQTPPEPPPSVPAITPQ
jgi:hypothetical protein